MKIDQSIKKSLEKRGIYRIFCAQNNHFYIGSTCSKKGFIARYRRHVEDLESKKHCNKALQATVNKYGPESIEFQILEIVPENWTPIQTRKLEQAYIDRFHSDPNCINMSLKASGNNVSGKSKYHQFIDLIKRLRSEKKSYREIARIFRDEYRLKSHWIGVRNYFLRYCNGKLGKESKYEDFKNDIISARQHNAPYTEILHSLRNSHPEISFTFGGLYDFCSHNCNIPLDRQGRSKSFLCAYHCEIEKLLRDHVGYSQISHQLNRMYGLSTQYSTIYYYVKNVME